MATTPYESTLDFKHRLAIAARKLRGEGTVSILGAAHVDPCVVRSNYKRPFDCTAAIEQLEEQLCAN